MYLRSKKSVRYEYRKDFYYFSQRDLAGLRANKAQNNPYYFTNTYYTFFAKRFLKNIEYLENIDFI